MWVKLYRNYYIFNILASGTVPYPRAAHAAASPENNKLLVYGGAVMGKNCLN